MTIPNFLVTSEMLVLFLSRNERTFCLRPHDCLYDKDEKLIFWKMFVAIIDKINIKSKSKEISAKTLTLILLLTASTFCW
jgi:hypothetical protein